MPTLDEVPATDDPTHLLLIGDTKMGKSVYAAQLALDGFKIIYEDSDNGISALRYEINRVNPAAMKNVMYYRTNRPSDFLKTLLESSIFRWNITEDKVFASGTALPDSKMVEIIPSRIPKGIVLVNDSWTSTALDAMEIAADNKKAELETMMDTNQGQQVYGAAGMKLKLICAILQQVKFNVMILAHPTVYEIYAKPKGKQDQVKQRDMTLIDSIKVPLSSSRANGLEMGKYFTDIGWLELDHANRRQLNFKLESNRIGGGRPNKVGNVEDMSFKTLFGGPQPCEFDSSWIREMTTEEWKLANSKAGNAGAPAKPELPKAPANPNLNMLKR